MTTENKNGEYPASRLLRQLAGKWKPQIFLMASKGPVRFSQLLRELPGSSKQVLANALREMEEMGFLERTVVSEKPLHVEYRLSAQGEQMLPIFKTIEEVIQQQQSGQ
jgi:DNA-binding HxlR family transcriptional regulator